MTMSNLRELWATRARRRTALVQGWQRGLRSRQVQGGTRACSSTEEQRRRRAELVTCQSVRGKIVRTEERIMGCSDRSTRGFAGVPSVEAGMNRISSASSWRVSIGVFVPCKVDGRMMSSLGSLARCESYDCWLHQSLVS